MKKVVLLVVFSGWVGIAFTQVISGMFGKRVLLDIGVVASQAPANGFLMPKYNLGISYITDNYASLDFGLGFESNNHEAFNFGYDVFFGDKNSNILGRHNDIKGTYLYNELSFRVGKTWYVRSRGDLAPLGLNAGFGLYAKGVIIDYSKMSLNKLVISEVTGENEVILMDVGAYGHVTKNFAITESALLWFRLKAELPFSFGLATLGDSFSDEEFDYVENDEFFKIESTIRNIIQLELGIKYAF